MLENKKVIVIGGTTGIGLAAAQAFIANGAGIVATGIDEASCEQAQRLLGERAVVKCLDARQPGTAQEAIHSCHRNFGGLDGLYHVAGGSGRRFGDGPLHELTIAGWNKTLELNLTSIMLSNQAVVQYWLDQGQSGSILNLSSVLAYSPSPKYFYTHAYATAKAAVIGFSKATAAYYASNNIRINVLAPALVKTPMSERAQGNEQIMQYVKTKQPLDGGRIGDPADFNHLACYFMSDHSRFTTGQVIAVDGGWALSEGGVT